MSPGEGHLGGCSLPAQYLEWRTGMEHLARMLPMMMASRSVQVPDSHSGIRIPVEEEEESGRTLQLRPFSHPRAQLTAGWDSSCRSWQRGPDLPTFEPGCRLEQSLLQSHVEVEIEALVLGDVIPDPWQQHQVVEPLGHPLLQVGRKYPGGKQSTRGGDRAVFCEASSS